MRNLFAILCLLLSTVSTARTIQIMIPKGEIFRVRTVEKRVQSEYYNYYIRAIPIGPVQNPQFESADDSDQVNITNSLLISIEMELRKHSGWLQIKYYDYNLQLEPIMLMTKLKSRGIRVKKESFANIFFDKTKSNVMRLKNVFISLEKGTLPTLSANEKDDFRLLKICPRGRLAYPCLPSLYLIATRNVPITIDIKE